MRGSKVFDFEPHLKDFQVTGKINIDMTSQGLG